MPVGRQSLRRLLILAIAVLGWLAAGPGVAGAAARTWYVKAGAGAGGNGSAQAPFGSLSAVEQAAGPGDAIVVVPGPSGTAPLDGGIALKPGQVLEGGGPSVIGLAGSAPAPRITNTTSAHSGDAVELADGARVSNLVVVDAARGGIYGSDVKDVTVEGNDLSDTNTSCQTGFVVQPFVLPLFVAGQGVPFSSGLSNGWASIMVDELHTTTSVLIKGNYVHDSPCTDGIDVRGSVTSNVSAEVQDNTLTRLKQGPAMQSELAIGMQTTGTSTLDAHIDGNTETYIGTATAKDFGESDSEGVFGNSAGRSHLIEQIDHNTFAHGLGHVSANCVETAASNGGPTMNITLTNSTCQYVVGDILEAANLSRDAALTFKVDHVLADHSTFQGSQAWAPVEPGDDGDCMLEVASGAHSSTSVTITNSRLTDCVADGLGVVSNVVDGSGPVDKLSFSIDNSTISSNEISNLRLANATAVAELDGRVQRSDISQSPGTNVILENLDTSGGTHANLDLGGGRLHSQGRNCIDGGGQGDVTTTNYSLDAIHDWWGDPAGPAPGNNTATGGSINYDPPLAVASCGPTTTPPAASPPRPPAVCTKVHRIVVRLPRGWRRAIVTINGRRAHVKRIHGQLIARIKLRRPAPRTVLIRAHGTNKHGKHVNLTKRYRACR